MGEIFETDAATVSQTVKLTVNGTPKGDVRFAQGTTLQTFIVAQAREAGIRTFSAYIDGEKLYTENSHEQVEGGTSIEIVAKDSRG